jgi:pSer/pThr/pTyr-binding forkhead associated (FHA) protein
MTVQPLPTLIDTFTKSTAFAAEEVFFDCQSTSELRLRQYVLRLLAPQGRKLEFAAKETLEKLDNPSSEITFGRSPNADVSVKFDCCMSRLHAAVGINRAGQLYVRDMGSKNGTFLNSTKLPFAALSTMREGDQVSLGASGIVIMIIVKH